MNAETTSKPDISSLRLQRAKAAFDTHKPPDGMVMRARGNWRQIGENSWQLPVQASNASTWHDGNLFVEFYPLSEKVIRAHCLPHDRGVDMGRNEFQMDGPDQPFHPVITGNPGEELYWDGSVLASVGVGTNSVHIYEWSSFFTGRGRTTRALEWLKETYGHVSAINIGEVDEDGAESPTVTYWKHMRDKGLIDRLVLDDDTELEPDRPGIVP